MEKIKTAKRSLEVYNFSLFDKNDMNTRMDYCSINNNDLYDVLKNNIPQYFENIGPEKLSKKTIKIDNDGANIIFKSNSKLRIITGKIKIGNILVAPEHPRQNIGQIHAPRHTTTERISAIHHG